MMMWYRALGFVASGRHLIGGIGRLLEIEKLEWRYMTFLKLSDYFSRLDGTTKRLELIDILSHLYREIDSADDARKVTYLLQGRVAAFYEPVEFGMAERLIERAVGLGTGVDLLEVQRLNRQMGDLGKVVEEIGQDLRSNSQSNHLNTKSMTISEVFDELVRITNEKGEGSVERKVEILAGVIRGLDALSGKYVVRIVGGTLRLGVGDITILEAMAVARLGDREYRKDLEKVYNEISDLGQIAKALSQDKGQQFVEKRLGSVMSLGVSVDL